MGKLIDFNKALGGTEESLKEIEQRLNEVVKQYLNLIQATMEMDKQMKKNQENYQRTSQAVRQTNQNMDVLAQSMIEMV